MKKAEIYAITVGDTPEYTWRWRSKDSKAVSAKSFPFYFDCLADAREQGYEVELTVARGLSAPGGAGYELDSRKTD